MKRWHKQLATIVGIVIPAIVVLILVAARATSPVAANPPPTATDLSTPTPTETVTVTSTPTATGTPTPSPTPTPLCNPTSAPAPPNLSPTKMSLRVYCDTDKSGLICDVGPVGRKCDIDTGTDFAVEVVASGPPELGYSAFKVVVQYEGNVTLIPQPDLGESKAPKCNIGTESVSPGRYVLSCKIIVPGSGNLTTFNGAIANVHFTCDGGPAQIDIVAGPASNGSYYALPGSTDPVAIPLDSTLKGDAPVADSVHINCNPAPEKLPEPGDTDGDGCSDQRENGPDETLGGRRDFLNPYDFYDVAGPGGGPPDGTIDLFADVLGVILHYSPNGGPPYDVNFDRGPSAGPNPWNLTAPDGSIDLFTDVLGVIVQFGHDCA